MRVKKKLMPVEIELPKLHKNYFDLQEILFTWMKEVLTNYNPCHFE